MKKLLFVLTLVLFLAADAVAERKHGRVLVVGEAGYAPIAGSVWMDATNSTAEPDPTSNGISVSKANIYTTVAPGSGLAVSKANIYTTVAPGSGLAVSKANIYVAMLPLLPGISVNKAIAYATITTSLPRIHHSAKVE